MIRLTTVSGVHRQLHQWPVVHMIPFYNKKAHVLDILKMYELPFPVLLGRDAPGFGELVRAALQDVAFVEDEECPSTFVDLPGEGLCKAPGKSWYSYEPSKRTTPLDHLRNYVAVSEV